MGTSGHALISSMGKLGVPAAVISFGVQSFDCVVDFAQGEIDGKELAHDLGENAAAVGGGLAGGVLLTAGIAAAAGIAVADLPVATAVATGLVGGMVGCALASEAYATIVEHAPEFISETAETLKTQAENAAREVVDLVKKNVPEKVENIRSSFNDFFADAKMPIHI